MLWSKKQKLAALLPAPLQQRLAPAEEVARQGQQQRHGVFRHRGARVVANVAHPDVGGATRFQIQVVAAGSGQGDEFQFRQLGQLRGTDPHFVDDGDAGIFQPLHHLFRGCVRVALPVVGEVGMVQGDARIQGIAVEKDDLLHEPCCHFSGGKTMMPKRMRSGPVRSHAMAGLYPPDVSLPALCPLMDVGLGSAQSQPRWLSQP